MNNKANQLKCPGCGMQNMREAIRFEVEIDTCMNCFGIWFDAEEMLAYVRGRKNLALDSQPPREAFVAVPREDPKACPRCRGISLQQGVAGELAMSRCILCKGVYLPKATYDAIYVASGKLPKRPKLDVPHRQAHWDDMAVLGAEVAIEVLGNALLDVF